MRQPLRWFTQAFRSGDRPSQLVALLSPTVADRYPKAVRVAVAGTTALALLGAALLGIVALAALLFALAAIYFLATQVLGLKVDFDPNAFYRHR